MATFRQIVQETSMEARTVIRQRGKYNPGNMIKRYQLLRLIAIMNVQRKFPLFPDLNENRQDVFLRRLNRLKTIARNKPA